MALVVGALPPLPAIVGANCPHCPPPHAVSLLLLSHVVKFINKLITITAVITTMAPPVEPACTNGKLFETCGTACPLTCDNYRNPPTGCIDECVEGCFCPHGLVELGAMCIPPTSCPGKFMLMVRHCQAAFAACNFHVF